MNIDIGALACTSFNIILLTMIINFIIKFIKKHK